MGEPSLFLNRGIALLNFVKNLIKFLLFLLDLEQGTLVKGVLDVEELRDQRC